MPLVEEASALVPPNEMSWPPKLPMAAATAFLVRTCELTEEKAKRLQKWHTDLHERARNVDFWLAYDVDARCISKEHPWRTWTPRPYVFNYSSAWMEASYPALWNVRSCAPQERHLAKPWVYHQESIALFFVRHGRRYRHTWVFEDDADYSGHISDFLAAYSDDDADLLSQPHAVTGDIDAIVPASWIWNECVTPSFAAAIPRRARRAAAEHVQRFSRRFLRHLHMASRNGLVAHSELSIPSLCKARLYHAPPFSWRALKPHHIGHKYCFDTRMTEDEFSSAPRGKLYHAVKPNPVSAELKDKDLIPQIDVPLDGGALFRAPDWFSGPVRVINFTLGFHHGTNSPLALAAKAVQASTAAAVAEIT